MANTMDSPAISRAAVGNSSPDTKPPDDDVGDGVLSRVDANWLVSGQTYQIASIDRVPGRTPARYLGREPEGGMHRFALSGSPSVIALTAAEVPKRVFAPKRLLAHHQAREEVHRRFQVWEWQTAPARKYALLVAGYYRSRNPFCLASEERNRSAPSSRGELLLELVEASADRPLSPTERAEASQPEDTLSSAQREAIEHLQLALSDPRRAAARLVGASDPIPGDARQHSPSYPSLLRLMECLWPAAREPAVTWSPPAEAVGWAHWMYEDRDFSSLPVLADLLEEAGCPDRQLLDHCRRHPEHVRGCAALDRLLGR